MIMYVVIIFLIGFLFPIIILQTKEDRDELFAENITLKKFYDFDISIDDVDFSEFTCD